jgi:hypothetical protein
MTLPFRGRHNDGEASHDRARSLSSEGLLQPLAEDDAAWLARHVESCGACRSETEAWLADHQLLQALKDRTPEPPRDLWARTSAAIDRETRGSRRRRTLTESGRSAGRDVWRGLPLGAAAGALVVAIVVGASLVQTVQPNATPGNTQVANVTDRPQPTNLEIANAGRVGWIRQAEDGTWELVLTDVEEVCPRAKAGCEALGEDSTARLDLGDATGLTISPNDRQLVVQSPGDASKPGKVYVVPVPSAGPSSTPTPPATEAPTGSAVIVTPPPASPGGSPIVTPSATPDTSPPGAIEIASGVTLVGEAAYSADGQWLAFSARPADSSAGPDLYLWQVGDAEATKVTDDQQTYFSSWHDGRVLASRVIVPAEPVEPGASGEPGSTAEPTPAATPQTPSSTPAASDAAPEPVQPSSFLLDPATRVRTDLTQPDVWLPVVDPAGRFTVYWSGALLPSADGLGWQLGEGELVLDEWLEAGEAPTATSAPAATSNADATADPSAAPAVVVGPAGSQVAIAVGGIATFQAKFDPAGFRVAVWAADAADAEVGRLHLVVLDPDTGTVDATVAPLPGAPALRRFSIDHGRLAWVSPRGQDGQESAVQVLGWSGRDFGEIQTIPAKDLFIVR